MKIAILGATGFVGSYLTQNLPYDIFPVTRDKVNLLDTAEVIQFFASQSFDIVINAAVRSNSDMNYFDADTANNNIQLFLNLYASRKYFRRLINFGSGAEFDRRYSVDEACEEDIFKKSPVDHYGMSKNICSRISYLTDNFYNLRLFGLYHNNEPTRRLLPKIISSQPVIIEDKYFDYFYLEDLLPVVNYYIKENPKFKDINVVYPFKRTLKDFVLNFCKIKGISLENITFKELAGLNYTGNASKILQLGLNFSNIEETFKRY
jgi:GDP-L-fucose synthase